MNHRTMYNLLTEQMAGKGVDLDEIKAALKAQKIETPSWGYGNSCS